jgi:quercetin dioxygenase-like cupin family protein
METSYLKDNLNGIPTIVEPAAGEKLGVAGTAAQIVLKLTSDITKDQFGLYEITLPPGVVGAQLHYHRFMDETFIVKKGQLTVQLNDRSVQLAEGGIAFAPRFTPHGFSNTSSAPVTLYLLFNPGQQREGFFKGLQEILSAQPVNPELFLQLYRKYDSFPVDVHNMLPKQ